MKKLCVAVALLTALPVASFAKDASEMPKDEINPFTQCGIGGAIFAKVPVAAAISNVIWDLGLTASSSSITSPSTCHGRKFDTAKLIIETLPEMEKDIAMGKGEYLTALKETISCDGIVSAKFDSELRASYTNVVASTSYQSKSDVQRASDMYNNVRNVTASFDGCQAVL